MVTLNGGMSLSFSKVLITILGDGNKKQHHNVYLCPQNLMAGCKPGLNAIQICTAGLSTPTEAEKKKGLRQSMVDPL